MRAAMTRTLAAGAVVLVLAACGASDPVASEPPLPSADAVAETSEPLEAVLVPTAAGKQLDFNSLRGQDVLLWFWAPW